MTEELPSCFGTITLRDACFRLPCCIHKIKCKEEAATDAAGEQKDRFSLRSEK